MPIVHNRVILSGTLGTSEVWSTSIAFMGSSLTPLTVNDDQGALNDWANEIASSLPTVSLSQLKLYMSSTCALTSVQTQFKAGTTLVLQSPEVPVTGFTGTGTQFQAFQTSMVISLLGASPGARHRGRLYWPATGAAMSSSHRLSGTATAVTQAKGLLEQMVTDSPEAGIRPAIFSPTYDAVTPVTSIKIGDVPDTQRRRRDSLLEAYQTTGYP